MRADVRHYSVALTGQVDSELRAHLLREDGQEDICLATYVISSGFSRTSMIVRSVILPEAGEREVHGNATFSGDYVIRAATLAAQRSEGIVVLHSHPGGYGWQHMSSADDDAERSFAYLAHEITGLPLVGMTLAGRDYTWSARIWSKAGSASWAESVRVIDTCLRVAWNAVLRPVPSITAAQVRTISGWGEGMQADIARLRVLVVGVGSVGLDVAQRLVASGIQQVGVMDFDTVETVNLDRLIGATRKDASRGRSKVQVAARLMRAAATAASPQIVIHEVSICLSEGLAIALDYDIIFSCVDRPWPRAVLNTLAYADLIPVIDGGIAIDPFLDGGMRCASWRSHVIMPGQPCLVCNGQIRPTEIALDRNGRLDDPAYIAGAGSDLKARLKRQNVALLSSSVSASLLAQFVTLVVAPGGAGVEGPLQYHLVGHSLEHLPKSLNASCYFEQRSSSGDGRIKMTGPHPKAQESIATRSRLRRTFRSRFCELNSRLAMAAHCWR